MPSEATDLSPEIENDMTFLGLAALFDPPRSKTESAVEEALSAGIRVFMLTGDHELTAHSIAKEVGIITSKEDDQQVVTGAALDCMSDEELTKILHRKEGVFARITPEQKLRITKTLKSMGDVVAVTGDGVNDSPALMEADVGIAMGAGGTDVARESADLVLLDNDFTSIIEGVKVGRSTFENLRKFAYYVWTHNWAEMMTFIACIMFNIPLPLLVIQVLCIDLGMDVIPSLSLIMEPPEPDIMAKPPRKKSEKLISISTLLKSFYVGLFISIGAMLIAFKIWQSGGWTFGMSVVPDPAIYARGTTAVMVGIMFGQLGNLFSARSDSKSAFHLSPLRNKWLLRGILAMFIIMIIEVYTPFLNPILGTAPLLPSDYLLLLPLIPATFLVEELRKLLTYHNIHASAS
jgi:magnesium-transporting ATPase (P-type)